MKVNGHSSPLLTSASKSERSGLSANRCGSICVSGSYLLNIANVTHSGRISRCLIAKERYDDPTNQYFQLDQ